MIDFPVLITSTISNSKLVIWTRLFRNAAEVNMKIHAVSKATMHVYFSLFAAYINAIIILIMFTFIATTMRANSSGLKYQWREASETLRFEARKQKSTLEVAEKHFCAL